MVKVQPTTDHDGVAAAAPSDLAEAAEAPAPACTQEHESEPALVRRLSYRILEAIKLRDDRGAPRARFHRVLRSLGVALGRRRVSSFI